MKKMVFLVAVISMFLNSTVFGAVEYNDNYYDLNFKSVSGELMIEAAGLFKSMGYTVSWDADSKTVLFSNGVSNINFESKSESITINGEPCKLDIPPIIVDGATYFPASLLKNLDITIDWDYKKSYPSLYSNNYDRTTETMSERGTEITTEALMDGWNDKHNEFYFNNEKLTGLQYIDGKMYNFNASGILLTGIFNDQTGVYGYDNYGNAYNGFYTENNKNYYFINGKAYTSPTEINDKIYNFGADGTFTTGWNEVDDNKTYNNQFGYPEEGIVEIDGNKYLFIDGIMKVGEINYGNKDYLFNDDGIMVTNELVGDTYYDDNGVGQKRSKEFIQLLDKVNNILSQFEKNPENIYDYVVKHVKYKYMGQEDWTTMANTAFSTGRGACYNFAACVDILLKEAGYETRVVRGTGFAASLHYWNQVKIDDEWLNIDTVSKFLLVNDSFLKSKNYTFDKYEYPEYY